MSSRGLSTVSLPWPLIVWPQKRSGTLVPNLLTLSVLHSACFQNHYRKNDSVLLKQALWMNMVVIFLILGCHFQALNSSHSILHSDFLFSNEFAFSQKQFPIGCFPRGIFPIDPVGSSSILLNAARLFIKYLCDHSFRFCNFKLVLFPISMHIFQIFLNLSASASSSLSLLLWLCISLCLCYPEEEQWTGTIQKLDCYIVMNFSSTKQISPLLLDLDLFKFSGYWKNATGLFQKQLEQLLAVSQRVFVSLWNLKNLGLYYPHFSWQAGIPKSHQNILLSFACSNLGLSYLRVPNSSTSLHQTSSKDVRSTQSG